jgi:hypothetical protein
MNYIEELQEVIRKLHGTESTHVETVPVIEEFQGETIWEGEVEVFDLHDHPSASRVYAWSHDTDDPSNPKRHVTVLHLPPAITPRKAVQVSIVNDYREQEANAES